MSTIEVREPVILESEGQKIFGVLHLPKGIQKPPCVLMCHGLGGHKTGRYRIYVDLAESLLKAGIASFRFDFRGCGDSEGLFEDMTLHGEVQDAEVAFQYLLKEPRIDNSRIGLFGRSMGGAVAVIVSAKVGAAKSLALWAPMFNGDDWRHMWDQIASGQASPQESEEMRRINGQVASLGFYSEMFSMRVDQELTKLNATPLLLIHGEKDEIINQSHSESYHQLRKDAKAVTRLIKLPNADHDFTHPVERQEAMEITTVWFKDTL